MLWQIASGTTKAAGAVAIGSAKIAAKTAAVAAPIAAGGIIGAGYAAVTRGIPFALKTAKAAYGPMGFGFLGARGGLLGRLAVPGAMLGAYGVGKAAYSFIRGPSRDWEGSRYTYNPPGRTTPYNQFPMDFTSRPAYHGGSMNVDGSMAFAMHNQRRT